MILEFLYSFRFFDLQEKGLVIVGDEGELDGCEDGEKRAPRKALVSVESAEMLQNAGEGSLGK